VALGLPAALRFHRGLPGAAASALVRATLQWLLEQQRCAVDRTTIRTVGAAPPVRAACAVLHRRLVPTLVLRRARRHTMAARNGRVRGQPRRRTDMDQETFNISIRKFLKTVGVGSQREIEQAVARAMATGSLAGNETLPATMTLRIDALGLEMNFCGEIELQ
jgi:hypothetical protein